MVLYGDQGGLIVVRRGWSDVHQEELGVYLGNMEWKDKFVWKFVDVFGRIGPGSTSG